MEHLALPTNPSSPLPAIPYLCHEPCDSGPFLEYLDRNPGTLFSKYYGEYLITQEEICRHFQTWLFFGLLQEFFAESFRPWKYQVYNPELELVVISTRSFQRDVQRWKRGRLRRLQEQEPSLSHLAKCLDEVHYMLSQATWRFPGYDKEVGNTIDLIASVAEALESAMRQVSDDLRERGPGGFKGKHDWLRVSFQDRNDILSDCSKAMVKQGWCPNDVARAKTKFGTCEAWHYLRHLKLNNESLQHVRCDETSCRFANLQDTTRKPKHVEIDCLCTSFEAKSSYLTEAYSAGGLPCLVLSSKGKVKEAVQCRHPDRLQVELVVLSPKYDPTQPYVAISHVANGGTGNSEHNSLPRCQLSDMWIHAEAWRDANLPELTGEPVYLWIDTICCPCQQGRGKNLALSRMKEIYNNALFVLVVDRSLTEWDTSNAESLEYLVRLYFSPWMRRLWTAQEAIVAGLRPRGTVVVQFGNTALDWTTTYMKAAETDGPAQRFAFDLGKEFVWLEKGLWFGNDDAPALADLRTVANVLQYRFTSVAADEALVLANLLQFSVQQFIGLTQEAAMCRFWKEVSEAKSAALPDHPLLQKQIVFLPAPRLCTIGFRWAPRSFLDMSEVRTNDFFAWDTLKYRAQLTPRGLMASYPSFRLHPASAAQTFCLSGDATTCELGANAMLLEMPDKSSVMTSDFRGDLVLNAVGSRELLRSKDLCLLRYSEELPVEKTYTYALWVDLKEEVDGVKYGEILEPTHVAQGQTNSAKLQLAAKQCCVEIVRQLQQKTQDDVADLDLDIIKEVSCHQILQFLHDNPTVLDVIRLDTRSDMHDRRDYTFDDCVRSFTTMVHYFGHVGDVMVEVYPDNTVWCLD